MKKNLKRIGALLIVLLLFGLYIWTFVAAILAKPEAGTLFYAAILCTTAIPVMIYIYIWFGGLLKKMSTREVATDTSETEDSDSKQ